jgi:mannosyltransferase
MLGQQALINRADDVTIPRGQPRLYTAARKGDDPPVDPHGWLGHTGPSWTIFAIPIAIVAGVITFIGYGRQMWIDEYVTVYVTKLSTSDFVHLLHNQDLVHALYYSAMRIWTSSFGTSLLALRLPSMIGMAVAAGAVAVLGRRICNLTTGVAAGLIFAVLPAVSRYGEEARSYGWVVALAVLSTLALTSAIRRPTALRWLAYVALTITLTYLHFAAALVMLPHGILAWSGARRRRQRQFASWIASAATVTVVASPLLLLASKQSSQVDWIQSNLTAVKQYPTELFGSQTVFWMIALAAIVGAVRLARPRPGAAVALVAWALIPPLFDYATVGFAHLFLAKYALFTLPAWVILASAALAPAPATEPAAGNVAAANDGWAPGVVDGHPTRRDRRPATVRWQIAGVIGMTLVIALAGLSGQRNVRHSPLAGEPDFQSAARVVDAGYKPGDGIVYVGTYRFGRIPFDYELHTARPADVYAAVSMADNGWFYPQDCTHPAACLGTTPRVWLVVTNYSTEDYTGLPSNEAAPLRAGYHPTSTATFENIRIVLLVRNRP